MEHRDPNIPAWLLESQSYEPRKDSDAFIAKSILGLTSVLAHFRLDDGKEARFSPSAPMKLLLALGAILLVSLSRNYLFALLVLACVLLRLCFLPAAALKRTVAVAGAATGLTFLLMLPAILIGQSHAALLIATKVLLSTSIAMIVALGTPFNQLTAALRSFHVPNLVILAIDLALKSIVRLGNIALEVLTALRLRSVGRNDRKREALGGVGGVVFLKTNEAAQATYDAMACRGFEGEYLRPTERTWRAIDLAWLAAFALLLVAFLYLQGAV